MTSKNIYIHIFSCRKATFLSSCRQACIIWLSLFIVNFSIVFNLYLHQALHSQHHIYIESPHIPLQCCRRNRWRWVNFVTVFLILFTIGLLSCYRSFRWRQPQALLKPRSATIFVFYSWRIWANWRRWAAHLRQTFSGPELPFRRGQL